VTSEHGAWTLHSGGPGDRGYSEQTAQAIDDAVRGLIAQAFAAAVGILDRDRDVLERSAQVRTLFNRR